jgi:hypothetical protein
VTAGFADTERFDAARHDVTDFKCGNELLDRWLVRYAGQNQRRDAARTFVAPTSDRGVYGYYTLLAGPLGDAPRTLMATIFALHTAGYRRCRPPWPATLRDGAAPLSDAVIRVVRATEQVAVRAMVVHTVAESASSYYEQPGVRALSASPRTPCTCNSCRPYGHAHGEPRSKLSWSKPSDSLPEEHTAPPAAGLWLLTHP